MTNIYQTTVPTSPAVPLCTVPSGATVLLAAVETNADVFLGMNTLVTSTTGWPLPANATTTINNPPWAPAFTLYAISGTGGHGVGVFIIPGR